MRQSKLFGRTLREDPKEEISSNAKLLERGGFVYKTMAGVYDYLPLGYLALQKVVKVIREEMNAIGGQEVMLSALQPKDRWERTGRWEELGKEIMYQFTDRSEREIGLAATHEEPLTEIALRILSSYKDLPFYVYQFQTKFRDELRAKSGLLRGREFLMKDLYSFHADEDDLHRFYTGPIDHAYKNVFRRCGLPVRIVEASGGAFTKEFTHEYQVLSDAGEDFIFLCDACDFAQNKEIASVKEQDKCPKCKGVIKASKSIEVGNIFKLGTKYSKPLGLYYQDAEGGKKPVFMGSYGIGVSRLMAAVVEIHHDRQGILWPDAIAPYGVHILKLSSKNDPQKAEVKKETERLYDELLLRGVSVLYDDRDDKTAGEKFADADLIGIPWRVVVSEKTLEKKRIEVKKRSELKASLVTKKDFFRLML